MLNLKLTFNFGPINGPVNAGGNVETQNNYNNQTNKEMDPEFKKTLIEIREFLDRLNHQSDVHADVELEEIINVEFEKISDKDNEKWNRWRTYLDLAFVGGVETAKILTPWVGVPIEVLKKVYEVRSKSRKRDSLE